MIENKTFPPVTEVTNKTWTLLAAWKSEMPYQSLVSAGLSCLKGHNIANGILWRVWYSAWNLALEQRELHEIWRSDISLVGEEGEGGGKMFAIMTCISAERPPCLTSAMLYKHGPDEIGWQSCLQQGWALQWSAVSLRCWCCSSQGGNGRVKLKWLFNLNIFKHCRLLRLWKSFLNCHNDCLIVTSACSSNLIYITWFGDY